jgi:hypothetical protein
MPSTARGLDERRSIENLWHTLRTEPIESRITAQ